jgi:hypothetical protein
VIPLELAAPVTETSLLYIKTKVQLTVRIQDRVGPQFLVLVVKGDRMNSDRGVPPCSKAESTDFAAFYRISEIFSNGTINDTQPTNNMPVNKNT